MIIEKIGVGNKSTQKRNVILKNDEFDFNKLSSQWKINFLDEILEGILWTIKYWLLLY